MNKSKCCNADTFLLEEDKYNTYCWECKKPCDYSKPQEQSKGHYHGTIDGTPDKECFGDCPKLVVTHEQS